MFVSEIEEISGQFGLDPNLITAIMMTESSGDQCAYKYEPGFNYPFKHEDFAHQLKIDVHTELAQQKASWGLLQIMGGVARERGFVGRFMTELCTQPKWGIFYGAKHLAYLTKRFTEESAVVSAYNRGSPIKDEKGAYLNQGYVDKVTSYLRRLRV